MFINFKPTHTISRCKMFSFTIFKKCLEGIICLRLWLMGVPEKMLNVIVWYFTSNKLSLSERRRMCHGLFPDHLGAIVYSILNNIVFEWWKRKIKKTLTQAVTELMVGLYPSPTLVQTMCKNSTLSIGKYLS